MESVGRAVSTAPAFSVTRAVSAAPAVDEVAAKTAAGLADPLVVEAEGGVAVATEAAPDLDSIREAVCAALAREGHETAANLVLQGSWTEQGGSIQVEVAVRKAMLALTVNPEAEAICKKALKTLGATQKIRFVPGENGGAKTGAARQPAAIPGSVQSAALENPLVRKAQELFKAEIRSVLDLRDTN